MADESGDFLEPGEAAKTVVSLSQILLAPLDAIFKAQVHAGRSFLNFLLQLSYEDKSGESEATSSPEPQQPDRIFSVDFVQEVPRPIVEGQAPGGTVLQKVSVPALALVPLRPLSIEEAQVDLAMEVTYIGAHRQTRQQPTRHPASEETPDAAPPPSGENRPWYLVRDPISLRGHVAPDSDAATRDKPLIRVSMKVAVVPMPAGLDKLLTTLTQTASVTNIDPNAK